MCPKKCIDIKPNEEGFLYPLVEESVCIHCGLCVKSCPAENPDVHRNHPSELYEQYADGNMSKEEFIRQRDAYRVQEDERMEQIQRLRTEKDQIFQPVKKDTDNLQAMMNTVGEAGDVMHLSQNVVEAFIDRIEVFNDERVKIHFTFEDVLADHAE